MSAFDNLTAQLKTVPEQYVGIVKCYINRETFNWLLYHNSSYNCYEDINTALQQLGLPMLEIYDTGYINVNTLKFYPLIPFTLGVIAGSDYIQVIDIR